ncbi:unnamed protein product [Meloidogyne enterolobii]|uniref:Uncharacterized protein n=1 Tax=Meloidogyne enterolobii TaxID=390850 RepID=A0ACB0YGM9_MELEN
MFQKAIIQNVVSTSSLTEEKEKLDLNKLAATIKNSKYRPNRFSALIIKIREPIRATALLFSNGRIVCVGTKSVKDSKLAMQRFVDIISATTTIRINIKGFNIQNIVSSFAFPGHLNLPGNTLHKIFLFLALYDSLRIYPPVWLARHISYNPEFFPGMCLRINDSRTIALVFTTGKCIITGAKSEDEIYLTQNLIYNSILTFLK